MGKYYGVSFSSDENGLAHHGIKGQRWGIRRFQNEDGTLTDAGKQRYGKDSELKEIHSMEQKDYSERANKVQKPFRDQLIMASSSLTKKDKVLFSKVKEGQTLTAKEKATLQDAWKKYQNANYKLEKQHFNLLRKNNTLRENDPIRLAIQKKNEEIAAKMAENRKATAEAEYANALNKEFEYAESIKDIANNQTNKIPVDPSYRVFSSKEEKAKAEADYMKNTWLKDPDEVSKEDEKRFIDECVHIQWKVTMLSMDGYDGIPKSERNKAMYDYTGRDKNDQFNTFDSYDNWIPKYEKTDEWKALEKQEKKILDESDYNRLNKEYRDAESKGLSEKEIDKIYKAMHEAYRERDKQLDAIKKEKVRIQEPFYTQIAKNALLDIGYEVTPENVECIFQIIWYD